VNDIRDIADKKIITKAGLNPAKASNAQKQRAKSIIEDAIFERQKELERHININKGLDLEREKIKLRFGKEPPAGTKLRNIYNRMGKSINIGEENIKNTEDIIKGLKETLNEAKDSAVKAENLERRVNRRRGIAYVAVPSSIAIYEGTKALQNWHDEQKIKKALKKDAEPYNDAMEKVSLELTGKALQYIDDLVGASKALAKATMKSADETLQMTTQKIQKLAPKADLSRLDKIDIKNVAGAEADKLFSQRRTILKKLGGPQGVNKLTQEKGKLQQTLDFFDGVSGVFGNDAVTKINPGSRKGMEKRIKKINMKLNTFETISKREEQASKIYHKMPDLVNQFKTQKETFDKATEVYGQAAQATRKARVRTVAGVGAAGAGAAGVNTIKKKKDEFQQPMK
jgi:hypothetical protein